MPNIYPMSQDNDIYLLLFYSIKISKKVSDIRILGSERRDKEVAIMHSIKQTRNTQGHNDLRIFVRKNCLISSTQTHYLKGMK